MAPLLCPACPESALTQTSPRQGLSVDHCAACGGAWLDIGEVYAFTRDPNAAKAALKAAYGRPMPSTRSCPRCARNMSAVRLESSAIIVEACPGCGGNWFDKGEMAKFVASLTPPAAPVPDKAPSKAPLAATPAPASAPAGDRPRPLSDEESAQLAGPDTSVFIAGVVIVCGAAALGLLWGLRGSFPLLDSEGLRPFLIGALAVVATAVPAARAASSRARRLRGAWLVPGEVTARQDRGSVLVELVVQYPFGDRMRGTTAQVTAGGPLDAAIGARSWVAVRPDQPDAGIVVLKP
ncbi:MAG: zf-TFIIB domain-containing protein [Elusimicrobia bacterium]|nr:zf-TFIIB domain-containing protein [Elusimicrobiota bacterium]